jgi:hypothetical protein
MTEQLTLTAGDGSVTGFLARGKASRPLLVCIPGGSYNARYFDVPGHSFVQAAIEPVFSVAALNPVAASHLCRQRGRAHRRCR